MLGGSIGYATCHINKRELLPESTCHGTSVNSALLSKVDEIMILRRWTYHTKEPAKQDSLKTELPQTMIRLETAPSDCPKSGVIWFTYSDISHFEK